MIRNKMGGVLTCCDRCDTILATNFDFSANIPTWEYVVTPRKGRQGHTRRYDFCDEKCRIIYFRGKKYLARKLTNIEINKTIREVGEAIKEVFNEAYVGQKREQSQG